MKPHLLVFVLILVTVTMFAQAQKSPLPLPDSGDVTLPLDEYNKLLELASRPVKKPDVAPQNFSIKCAQLKFHVDGSSVIGSMKLEGEVFRKGVIKVPLVKGMTTFDARQDGKGVPLQQENGTQIAVLNGPADFAITLNAGLPLRIDAGRASFSLPAPASSSAQLTLVVPGEHTFVNINPGLIISRASSGGNTVVEATLVPGQSANIWWATRETALQAVPKEARFLSDIKTLISVSESELRAAALADVTVVQGEPSQFAITIPEGYEVTGVTGASLESTEASGTELTLKVSSSQHHQFLISMERSITDTKATAPFLGFKNAQRETGEVLVDGTGTLELTATEGGGLKRMDVKETSVYLRALAHSAPQAAFRFHRQPNEHPTLTLAWTRFPDSSVLAAVAESAAVTTLVTSEGKTLTEIKLTVKNQAQPFLKVALPPDVSILSAEVAGERVKPVQGSDGSRVPLLRPGFRPSGSYEVSFVFMHAGTPFARKGGSEITLPSMDLPISMLNWEVFLPDRYQVKDFGGDVISAGLLPETFREEMAGSGGGIGAGIGGGIGLGAGALDNFYGVDAKFPGQVGGVVLDPSGAVVPGARVSLTNSAGATMNAVTNSAGRWIVSNVPSGGGKLRVEAEGFQTLEQSFHYDANRPAQYLSKLSLGSAAETIEVSSEAVTTNAMHGPGYTQLAQLENNAKKQTASPNVVNLQRRVAGVLPVAIDVPHAGTSFQFARALVLDEETRVTFSYKSR